MSDKSSIEWLRDTSGIAGSTWNPVVGCTKDDDDCDGCYAILDGNRLGSNPNPKVQKVYQALTHKQNGRLNWTGVVRVLPERLRIPYEWRQPRRIFVNSQSDLFHEKVPDDFIRQVFEVMLGADRHTYIVLTKRTRRMAELLNDAPWWTSLPATDRKHIHLGASCGSERTARKRLTHLVRTDAAVRIISYEPSIGPADFSPYLSSVHQLIIGGESKTGARIMHLDWARAAIRQCRQAGVRVFVKQLGSVWAKDHYGKGYLKRLARRRHE